MQRFTTPTHLFNISGVDIKDIDAIRVIYAQRDKVILVRNMDTITLTGTTAVVRLTQEETSKFSPGYNVNIQVRIRLKNGHVPEAPIVTTSVEDCLDNEVL